MPQSLSKVLIHTVFSTKERAPFLRDRSVREEMHKILGGAAKQLDCKPIIIGGVEDHVHLLTTLSRTLEIADFVKEVKRVSSKWIKPKGDVYTDFHWQAGYGCFSVGQSQIDSVSRYIANQEEHHKEVSFQEEFRRFLHKYEIDFDEQYVWD